jgi:membrane protease YdiL (CAAX protease family)
MEAENKKRTIRNLIIFTVSINVIGWLAWLFYLLNGTPESQGLGMLIWISSPLGISFLLRALAGDGWKDLGIKPAFKGNGGWYAVSILAYPLAIVLVLMTGSVLGVVSLPDFWPGLYLQAIAIAFVPTFIKNIFEEFGWRGYLTPKMATLGLNDLVAHLIVGLIWATWHLPYYFGLINTAEFQSYTTQSLATFIPLVSIGITASAILYGEIRLITGTVWPAVLMHTISNILINTLIIGGYVKMSQQAEMVVTPGMEGILSIIIIAVMGVGVYLWRTK